MFAAIEAGKDSVTANVYAGTSRDALRHSLGANAAHGLQRTNADKRRAVEIAWADREWDNLSNRAIATLCNVSKGLVAQVRDADYPSCHVAKKPPDGPRVGRDGKSYRTRPRPEVDYLDRLRCSLETVSGAEALELAVAADAALSTIGVATWPPDADQAAQWYDAGASVITAAHAAYYARLVREASLRRQMQAAIGAASDGLHRGQDARRVLTDLHASITDLHTAGDAERDRLQGAELAPTFAGVDTLELTQYVDMQPDWLVQDIFTTDQPALMGARSKATKTTQLADLSVALASQTPWMGKFEVPKRRRVLFITGEASKRAASRRLPATIR